MQKAEKKRQLLAHRDIKYMVIRDSYKDSKKEGGLTASGKKDKGQEAVNKLPDPPICYFLFRYALLT